MPCISNYFYYDEVTLSLNFSISRIFSYIKLEVWIPGVKKHQRITEFQIIAVLCLKSRTAFSFLKLCLWVWVKDLYFHLTWKICENGSPSLQRSKKDYTQTQLLNVWFLSSSSYIPIPNFLQRCQMVFSDTTEKHQDSDSKVPEPFMFILHIELVPWVQWSLRVEIFSVPHQISSFHRLLAKQNILFPLYFFTIF